MAVAALEIIAQVLPTGRGGSGAARVTPDAMLAMLGMEIG